MSPRRKPGNHPLRWRCLLLAWVGITVLSFNQASSLSGQTDPTALPAKTTKPQTVSAFTLADCLHLAQQCNPRLAAKRAALAAAEDGKRAVDTLRVPDILDRELPVRRRQACRGVTAAVVDLQQTEREVAYGVTRAYFTLIFAREQEEVARRVVTRLAVTRELAQKALDMNDRDAKASTVHRILVFQRLAETRQIEAASGQKRALAALREAMGQEPDCVFFVAPGRLPEPRARLERADVVAAALAQRSELIQARLFAEVSCLEVEAQATSMHLKMETFAAGSDIHANVVPQGSQGRLYRPAALAPAMPTILAGSRTERVQRAAAFNAQAEATAQVTRNLIALEAEDAFLRWEQAVAQVAKARDAAESGDKLADELNGIVRASPKAANIEDALNAAILASQAHSQYNEYLLDLVVALADLERVTGGVFCAHLAELSIAVETTKAAK
jgi:outer membrane protein TolC